MIASNVSTRVASSADAQTVAALAIQLCLDTYATEGVRPDLASDVGPAWFTIQGQSFGNRIFFRSASSEPDGHR